MSGKSLSGAKTLRRRRSGVPFERRLTAYEALEAQFTQEEQVKLTLVINVIGAWNRIAVGFRMWLETDATRKLQAAA